MRIPGTSFLGAVKQKLRKAPAADSSPGEGASPSFPTVHQPGVSNVSEPIALASPGSLTGPRGIHEMVSPFIDPEENKPGPLGPIQPGPSQPSPAADAPGPQAKPSDPTTISAQSGNGLVANIGAPATPENADQGAAEGPIGEPSSGLENDKSDLRELFARKSVVKPAVKTLLERHHPVNTRALNRELKEFARQLGLSPPNE